MYELDKKKFGAFVAELRKEKGYTQKELAEKLFISDKAVSKWETAVSIPDTSLLIPLAELLGVSVTELLMCQRVKKEEVMETGQVENIVKAAISMKEEKPLRAYKVKSQWPKIYLTALVLGGIGIVLNYLKGTIAPTVYTAFPLGAVFGIYFCFLVPLKLSGYYDENRISVFYDTFFRMNMVGTRFNNSNWPYVVLVSRVWSCAMIAVYPWISLMIGLLFPTISWMISLWIFLIFGLGGYFFPVYVVGKKYE